MPSVIWPRLAQLICLPDLAVVCACLDALRCLTNLGYYACLFAWQACQEELTRPTGLPLTLLQPLLALLTLEGQAMGSQSLHRIKVSLRKENQLLELYLFWYVYSRLVYKTVENGFSRTRG